MISILKRLKQRLMDRRKKMKYAVDRIEGDYAVLEDLETREIINIELTKLPNVRETDVLVFENGEYKIDENAKEERIKTIRDKMNSLRGE